MIPDTIIILGLIVIGLLVGVALALFIVELAEMHR
jgi:hypothetical protein